MHGAQEMPKDGGMKKMPMMGAAGKSKADSAKMEHNEKGEANCTTTHPAKCGQGE